MDLKSLLHDQRDLIVKKWCEIVISTYPEQSRKFLKKQKDAIANPVGASVFEGVQSVFDELLAESEPEQIVLFLDNIIRVRAVQDFSPSQAVSFIFELKAIIRDALQRELKDGFFQEPVYGELVAFEAGIDALALRCFDIYTRCREQIFDIRVNEVKNQSARLLKLAGMVCEVGDKPGTSEEEQ
jgi:hypothetical protein